ncbi:MAG: CPBP family intramembrane metalloprotease [Myxacorys californica WJT36-NPBG1]|nr:CPBP family intramembrane metalloprotease [Myxacorys californica WJT36-NPBG1]
MKLNLTRIAQYPTPIRIGLFVLTLLTIWVPIALPITRLVSDNNLATILTMPLLYAEFVLLVVLWGRFVYQQPNLLKRYGFRQPRRTIRNLAKGLSIGLISLMLMFVVQSLFGWVIWQAPQPTFAQIFVEGAIVAIAYGVAEELLFRGWLLDELQRGYSARTALLLSSLIFAGLHLRFVQFPALFVLGLILVWAKRATDGRLGLSIGLHAGLIWGYYIVNVGQLVKYSNHVPEWVTGVERNPLAGIVGIFSLGAIALWMRTIAQRQQRLRLSQD